MIDSWLETALLQSGWAEALLVVATRGSAGGSSILLSPPCEPQRWVLASSVNVRLLFWSNQVNSFYWYATCLFYFISIFRISTTISVPNSLYTSYLCIRNILMKVLICWMFKVKRVHHYGNELDSSHESAVITADLSETSPADSAGQFRLFSSVFHPRPPARIIRWVLQISLCYKARLLLVIFIVPPVGPNFHFFPMDALSILWM